MTKAAITPEKDAVRNKVNAWIRKQSRYVDMDRALSTNSGDLKPKYDSGDGMHPNLAGQQAMAQTLLFWIKS